MEATAPGVADVGLDRLSSSLWATRVVPRRSGAASADFVLVQDDEVSGRIGRAHFYLGFARSDQEWLVELVTLLVEGRVEERWSPACRLRAVRHEAKAVTFGQWGPLPWWLSPRRKFAPYR